MLGMYSKDGVCYVQYNNIPVYRSSVETCLQKPLIIHPYNPAINILQYFVAELVCYYERKQEGSSLYRFVYIELIPISIQPITLKWFHFGQFGRSVSADLHSNDKNSNICAKATIISAITTLNYLICGCLGTSCLFEHWSISVHLVFLLILNICSAFLMSVNTVLDNSVRTIGLPQRKCLGFLIHVSSKDGVKPALNKS